MRKRIITVFSLFFLLIMTACGNDKPEPETNSNRIVPVVSQHQPTSPMHVKHEIKGKDVFVECIVTGFTFQKGAGHIDVYLNGKKINEVFTAAFVIRGLPTGKHTIRLELVDDGGRKSSLSHEFEVNIS
ncbi:hypothetical protein HNR31_000880 [Anoxybacillus caldiproteolyticus]|uniref:Lipoprotein n=1 Tax=Thermaerobacillus caldiproteolyticus TaxID=247480 RepID=A0A7V9Z557_9BACL|nr:hypothetical protein [Anoxybacillus caldiproteolyticus]